MRTIALLSILATVLLPGPAATAKPRLFDPAREVQFTCSVNGLKHLHPVQTAAQVCAVFKRKVDGAIARQTRAVRAMQVTGNAVGIILRIKGPHSASAVLITRSGGKTVSHPELTIDVMDKSISLRDLDTLATQIARKLV